MSQRNPMNDRYTTEGPKGQTRKSAAAAKPKTKAASSVHVQPVEKTKEQKKAERKAKEKEDRQRQRNLDAKYYNPPTPEYKKWRRIWWVLLIAAIICTVVSFFGRSAIPQELAFVILALAYVFIIAAFFVDFRTIRRIRRKYQEEMEAANTKAARAEQKRLKAEARAQKKEAEEKFEAAKAEEAEKAEAKKTKRGFFGSGFRLANREKMNAEKAAAKAESDDAKNAS
ncbi:hypothetical protein GMI68_08865 [Eggerthellaceae bacterium zg-886]|uniref:Uncharacterized protein n=2 Tax=Xiamenia xianingshaonis TaxID=2682776 RepID=A0A9E6MQ15_9ACTN|nr:hypothetical protein [Xiamenia xianingshaonis]QTU84030.1 hypothetical protein J7S26_06605 [Xiamenia xianingshaonis]